MWIFGYGSLMWKTEFNFLDKKEATLNNYHRDFCIITERHRGNSKFRGLVLGLVEKNNSTCKGLAYKICHTNVNEVRNYLFHRELLEDSYIEKIVEIIIDGKKQSALTFVCNTNSHFYHDSLTDKEKANIIRKAQGHSGKNIDYYLNTINHLNRLGIKDEKIYNIKKHL